MILIFIIILLYFSLIFFIVDNNSRKDIIKKLKLDNVSYFNEYDNKYIILDDKNLYVFDKDYEKVFDISLEKICNKDKKYDIIYRKDLLVYMDDYYKDNDLIYDYYDIYTCKKIDSITLGG